MDKRRKNYKQNKKTPQEQYKSQQTLSKLMMLLHGANYVHIKLARHNHSLALRDNDTSRLPV